jgi:hypothetical protein
VCIIHTCYWKSYYVIRVTANVHGRSCVGFWFFLCNLLYYLLIMDTFSKNMPIHSLTPSPMSPGITRSCWDWLFGRLYFCIAINMSWRRCAFVWRLGLSIWLFIILSLSSSICLVSASDLGKPYTCVDLSVSCALIIIINQLININSRSDLLCRCIIIINQSIKNQLIPSQIYFVDVGLHNLFVLEEW